MVAIKEALGLDASLALKAAVQAANEEMGIDASGTMAEQVPSRASG